MYSSGSYRAHDRVGPVGRAVIDHDDLVLDLVLDEDALEASFNIVGGVIRRYDDTDIHGFDHE